mgnify:FL=1
MFKEIKNITKNYAIVEINGDINSDILNINVVIEDNDLRILGEVEDIDNGLAKIAFLGEFHEGKFYSGIIRRPSLKSNIRIINTDELKELVGENDDKSMLLGLSPLYNNYPVKINIDKMFSNHLAIFGNTGSGKTWGVSRLIQNLFNLNGKIAFNSNIFIFNNTDEYHNAFSSINKYNSNFNYKMYSTSKSDNKEGLDLKIPLWLLDVDDYANLLDITDYFQINIIEKMLCYVSAFAKNDQDAIKYKNHLIAKAIISVLYSNQVSAKIRDQIFNILKDCYTDELNLDVQVPGIGYTREFRKCFDIDNTGEFVERILVTKYIQSFIDNDTKWSEEYTPTYFTLDQLEVALNFTLISEGLLLNEKSYGEAIALKVKLHTLNNSSNKKFFEVSQFMTLDQYISSLILVDSSRRAQIINFVFDEIDDRLAKSLVKIFSRMVLRFSKMQAVRGSIPIHIMLEEAHRYVQNDRDSELLGYNIFERIAKEGRKFGVILDLITQRPTELSSNVLSQCSNFLIFKLNHPADLEYVEKMVPNISKDVIEKQKALQAGTCVAFGLMMKIPMVVKMQIPNPPPTSSNASIYDKWIIEWNNK